MGLKKWLESAIKCNYEDVPGEHTEMIYADGILHNNGYFHSIEELIDFCKRKGFVIPRYVHATNIAYLEMDAYSIAEYACDELHEDALDQIDQSDIDELQEMLDAWCSKQTGTKSYFAIGEYAIKVEARDAGD